MAAPTFIISGSSSGAMLTFNTVDEGINAMVTASRWTTARSYHRSSVTGRMESTETHGCGSRFCLVLQDFSVHAWVRIDPKHTAGVVDTTNAIVGKQYWWHVFFFVHGETNGHSMLVQPGPFEDWVRSAEKNRTTQTVPWEALVALCAQSPRPPNV